MSGISQQEINDHIAKAQSYAKRADEAAMRESFETATALAALAQAHALIASAGSSTFD